MSSPRQRGFSLIELIVVLVVSAVVAVFMVFFLSTPLEAYFSQARRGDLIDSGDRIVRALAPDVRSALPDSVRQSSGGGVWAIELLATASVARYYGATDKNNLPMAQEAIEELETAQADTDFYTLTQFLTAAGNALAVNSQGLPGAYALTGIMTPSPPQFVITPNAATAEDAVTIGGGGYTFNSDSPTRSAFLVSGPVSYLCDTNAHTLERYSGYAIASAQSTSDAQLVGAGATRSLIAQNVAACNFTIIARALPAIPTQPSSYGQLLISNITLGSGGETLQVFYQVASRYVP